MVVFFPDVSFHIRTILIKISISWLLFYTLFRECEWENKYTKNVGRRVLFIPHCVVLIVLKWQQKSGFTGQKFVSLLLLYLIFSNNCNEKKFNLW